MVTTRFLYQTPPWALKLILMIFFLVGCFFAWIAYNFQTLFPQENIFFQYFIGFLSVAFFFSVGHPRNHRPIPQFIADTRGILFEGENKKEDLLVPWECVGQIQIDRVDGEWDGLTIQILIKDVDIQRNFRSIKLTKKILRQPLRNSDGYFVIGFADAFVNRKKTVQILNEMKNAYSRNIQ